MIFATVGTNEAPFDRLLHALAALPPGEELVVQHGASKVAVTHGKSFEFLPFDALVEYVRRARIVLTHAGVGSILVALSNGVVPVVVPRLKQFGEAVDDHQLHFARRFAEAGLVELVERPDELQAVLSARGGRRAAAEVLGTSRLVDELRELISARVGAARPRAAS